MADATTDIEQRAVELATRWVAESAGVPADPAAGRLAGLLRDDGLPFARGLAEGVMRPESLATAASGLQRAAALAPESLPWHLRGAVRAGGAVAPVLPVPIVPIVRRALRDLVAPLIVDARPDRLGAALAKARADGQRLDLAPLGETVLGEREAHRRLAGIHELVRHSDVDRVSFAISEVVGPVSPWAFEEVVDGAAERLLPLYLSAAGHAVHLTVDTVRPLDIDLALAVLPRVLEDARLRGLEAGIALPSSLPEALPALQRFMAWAQSRVDGGGAPVTVRLIKGTGVMAERADALMRGRAPDAEESEVDAAARHLRCVDAALHPERTRAVRVTVAGHDPFDIAYAWLLARDRGVPASGADAGDGGSAADAGAVRPAVAFEMPRGVTAALAEAVSRTGAAVLLSAPVVRPDELDVAIGILVRRIEETAPGSVERQRDRFVAAVRRAADPALTGLDRAPHRAVEESPAPGRRTVRTEGADESDLTAAVLGIARGAVAREAGEAADTGLLDPSPIEEMFYGGEVPVETAVYAPRESGARGAGAPGFHNVAGTDPAEPAGRAWARAVLARVETSTAGDATIDPARVTDAAALESIVARVREAAAAWGARPAAERSTVLRAAARALDARRGELIEVAASETGALFAEADAQAGETVDLADYYAVTARELDSVSGAVFVPARLTVVAPSWREPLADAADGVLAALAAGSGVVLAPDPRARRCAAVIADALWCAGVPREVLALADVGALDRGDDAALGRRLVAHPDVDRVILTGSWETAALFRSWRADLPLVAATGGANAIVVMPSADLDLAVSALVESAFGRAGQRPSSAALAILVGPVARSKRFTRQLVDAVRSLRVGPPSDPRSQLGPVVQTPRGTLAWALSTLEEGEQWLVEPELVDEGPETAGRCWRPGIRAGVRPGSRFHREEIGGPVLGIMSAASLAEAIDLQNGASGMTAGLHTQSPLDLAAWLGRVEAGRLFVNRGVTGAVVQRQPSGGWKRSAVGAGAASGGPNRLVGLGSWRPSAHVPASATLHLRGLDTRIAAVVEAATPSLPADAFEWLRRAALSDAIAWDREFGQVKDVSRLGVERNLFRYRPVPVAVRATDDAGPHEVLRVAIAALRAGAPFTLSTPAGLPPGAGRALGELQVPVHVETDAQWLERMTRPQDEVTADGGARIAASRPPRARLVGRPDTVRGLRAALALATDGDPALAVFANEVTTVGRLELLPFLREQAIAITAHRAGVSDPWSEAVI